jgi:hypothetical protein
LVDAGALKERLVLHIDSSGRPNSISFDPQYLKDGERNCNLPSSNSQAFTSLSIGKGTSSAKVLKIDPPVENPSAQAQPEGIVGLVQRYVRLS